MQPTKLFSILSILAGSKVFAKNAQESANHVITASKENFDSLIKSEEPVLVEFFAPWCGHCKNLAPEFETAAEALKKNQIKLAAIDCTVEGEICAKHSVKGYPTLAVFKDGSEVTKYQGPRESGHIISFMKRQIGDAVKMMKSSDDLKKFVATDDVVVVGFFKDTASASAKTFSAVAEKMRSEYSFAIMTDPSGSSYKDGQVVMYKNFDEKEVAMKEKLSIESLTQFISAESFPLAAEIGSDNYAKYFESGMPLAYFFYANKEQREQYASAVLAAAKTVKGKVNVVFIDGSIFGQHAEGLNLPQEWPAFVIHDMKEDDKYPITKGDALTADSITKHLSAFLAGKLVATKKSEPIPKQDSSDPVVTLVHDNFDSIALDKNKDVLVEIYAPWCGACKRIAPEYNELAKNVAAAAGDKFVIAKMDGTANDIPNSIKFKLEHFPTFVLVKSGSNAVVSYEDDLTYNDLLKFLKTKSGHGSKLKLEEKEVSAAPVKEDHPDDSEEGEHMDL